VGARSRPALRARAERGELAAGTIDTFLVWRLTGGTAHVTDVSNASRTLLLDLHTRAWTRGAVRPAARAARAAPARCARHGAPFGTTRGVPGLPDGIPDLRHGRRPAGGAVRPGLLRPGEAKCTYGTGAFLMLNTGERPVPSQHGLLTTVALAARRGAPTYASRAARSSPAPWCSGCATASASSPRPRDRGPGPQRRADSGGVYRRAGLRRPRRAALAPYARGLITGLTRGTTARAPRPRDARGHRLQIVRRPARDAADDRAAAARSRSTAAPRPTTC
jgi:glycerol kinase